MVTVGDIVEWLVNVGTNAIVTAMVLIALRMMLDGGDKS